MSELSDAFLAAAKRLEKREAHCICYALSDLWHLSVISQETARVARSIIRNRLRGEVFYEYWMREHHLDIYDATPIEQRDERAREGRIAWCKALAKEFE